MPCNFIILFLNLDWSLLKKLKKPNKHKKPKKMLEKATNKRKVYNQKKND